MAKELPYFKFEPNAYLTGDITLCDYEAQGVFIHLCSFYWSRNCSISLAIAKQRYKDCLNGLDQLIEFNIVYIDEHDNLNIDFLNEQMTNFIDISARRANAGSKGGKSKANAKQKEANANIEEERREDEKKEEREPSHVFYLDQINQNENAQSIELYKKFVEFINGKNSFKRPLKNVLKIRDQLTYSDFISLMKERGEISLADVVESMENKPSAIKGNVNLYLTINNWIKIRQKTK